MAWTASSGRGTVSPRSSARRCRRAAEGRRRRPGRVCGSSPGSSDPSSVLVELGVGAATRNSGAPAGTNSPSAGTSSTTQSAPPRYLDQRVVVDRGHHARLRAADHRRVGLGVDGRPCRGRRRAASRLRADQLDERRHAERLADVVHVDHEHGDADQDEHEGRRRPRDRGRVPSPKSITSRMASIAWANVATKRPIASWLGLSWRNV